MKIKELLIFIILFFVSCQSKSKKEYVDEGYALENIKEGMTRKEVIKKIGMPKDSVEMYNSENVFRKIYSYDTNNFSGYSLKIIFNNKDSVDGINLDWSGNYGSVSKLVMVINTQFTILIIKV